MDGSVTRDGFSGHPLSHSATEARELRQLLCLGDLVGYGPFPNEVAA